MRVTLLVMDCIHNQVFSQTNITMRRSGLNYMNFGIVGMTCKFPMNW